MKLKKKTRTLQMKLMLNFFDNNKQKIIYNHYIDILPQTTFVSQQSIENTTNFELNSKIITIFNKCEKLSANYYKRKFFTIKHFYIGKLNKNGKKTFYKDLELENDDELYIEYFT